MPLGGILIGGSCQPDFDIRRDESRGLLSADCGILNAEPTGGCGACAIAFPFPAKRGEGGARLKE